MNHEALNMTNTTDQTTEVTKKVEAEPRPLLLFQKLGATANALVSKVKMLGLNKSMTPAEKANAMEMQRHNKEMKQLRKELQKTEKLIKRHERLVENDEATRSQYPEIFKNPDEKAIDDFQAEHLEQLEKEDWGSVMRSYTEAYQLPDKAERATRINKIDASIVDALCKELGFEDKKPTIKSVDRQDSDEVGGFSNLTIVSHSTNHLLKKGL